MLNAQEEDVNPEAKENEILSKLNYRYRGINWASSYSSKNYISNGHFILHKKCCNAPLLNYFTSRTTIYEAAQHRQISDKEMERFLYCDFTYPFNPHKLEIMGDGQKFVTRDDVTIDGRYYWLFEKVLKLKLMVGDWDGGKQNLFSIDPSGKVTGLILSVDSSKQTKE